MDLLCFCSVLCLLCLCARLFICALWSPAGKGLTSWLSFVVSAVSLSLSHWYPGSGVVLDVSIPDLCTLTYFVIIIYTRMQMATTQAYKDEFLVLQVSRRVFISSGYGDIYWSCTVNSEIFCQCFIFAKLRMCEVL